MPRQSLVPLCLLAVGCFSSDPAPDVRDAEFAGWETPDVVPQGQAAASTQANPTAATAALAFRRGAPTLEHGIDAGALADASAKPAGHAPRNRARTGPATAGPVTTTSGGKSVALTTSRKATTKKSSSLAITTVASGDGLSKNQVRNVVARSMGQVKACYERALKASPSLAGRIVVDWKVAPTGDVARASIRNDDIGDQGLQGCIIDTVKGWSFPTATASTPVSFPFTLKPG